MPDRVLDVEGLLIKERQNRFPLAGGHPAEDQAEQEYGEQGQDGRRRGQRPLADADRRQAPAGIGVERHHDICSGDHPEDDGEDEEGPDLGGKAYAEDAAVVEGAEPQEIGVERRERLQQEQDQQRQRDADDPEDRATRDADGGEARLGWEAPEG